MTREYTLAHKYFELSPQDVLDIVMSGVKSAFLPYEYKKDLIVETKKQVKKLIVEQYLEMT
jgi:adenosine deaminase